MQDWLLSPLCFSWRIGISEKNPRIDIDVENSFFASFDCPDHELNGKLGFGLYNMKVVNISNSAFTIEELTLRYRAQSQGVGSLVNIKEKLIYDKLKYAPEIIQIADSSQKYLVGSEQWEEYYISL